MAEPSGEARRMREPGWPWPVSTTAPEAWRTAETMNGGARYSARAWLAVMFDSSGARGADRPHAATSAVDAAIIAQTVLRLTVTRAS